MTGKVIEKQGIQFDQIAFLTWYTIYTQNFTINALQE